MPLKLYKRPNGYYHIRGTVQNERFDRSAKTRDRSEAEQIRAKWEADAFKRSVYGERAVGISFAEAVADYVRAGGEPNYLDSLLDEFGAMQASQIGQSEIDTFAAKRKGVKPSTLLRTIYTPVLAVLNFAAEGDKIDPPRIRKPTVKSGRTAFLTPAEADAWIEALPPHLAQLMTFYLATGCRASEALDLEWRDITPDAHRVVFWETKGGYARHVDLGERARAALPARHDLWFERRDANGKVVRFNPVFLTSRREPWHAYDAVNMAFRKVRQPAYRKTVKQPRSDRRAPRPDLPHIHCHLFRHTWATWAYAATRDLTYLMAHGGWRSLNMVQRYTHLGSRDLATAVLERGWEFQGREIWGLRRDGQKD